MLKERIKSLRIRDALTQKDLSEKLNLTPKMISFYELGERVPPPDILEKLADIFDVTIDYLMCRSDTVICEDCGYSYDPLDNVGIQSHIQEHRNWKKIVDEYGFCWSANKAFNERCSAEFYLKNKISKDEVNYVHIITLFKADFSDYLRQNNYRSDVDFNTFCSIKLSQNAYSELVSSTVYKELTKLYGVSNSGIMLCERDKRDIKKDLDSIMGKLTDKEYGPAAYDGEDLSPESVALFRDELEIALKRLKLINKEKYNPNKNKE